MTLGEYAPGDEPAVYWDPGRGKWVYRMSALGHCTKSLIAFRLGRAPEVEPINPWLQRALDQGHRNEPVILRKLYLGEGSTGVRWASKAHRQEEVEIAVGETAVLLGHLDDIATDGTREVVVEAKAFGKGLMEVWREKGVKGLPYAEQVSAYGHATGLPVLFVVGEKDDETKVVTRIHSVVIEKPLVGLAELKLKVARVEARAKLIQEAGGVGVGMPEKCDGKKDFCPFPSLHVDWQEAPVDEDARRELALAVFDAYWAGVSAAYWDKCKGDAKKRLAELAGTAKLRNFKVEVDGDEYEVVERESRRHPMKADTTKPKNVSKWLEVKRTQTKEEEKKANG